MVPRLQLSAVSRLPFANSINCIRFINFINCINCTFNCINTMSFFDPHFGLPLPEDVQSADSGIFDPIWYQPGAPLSLGNTLGPVAASALEPVATPTLGSSTYRNPL